VVSRCCDLAAGLGLRQLPPDERGAIDTPFDVNPVALPGASRPNQSQTHDGADDGSSSSSGGASGGQEGASFSGSGSLADMEAAVEAQGQAVRALKESGLTNQHPQVQAGVQVRLLLIGCLRCVGPLTDPAGS
jgi:hypothetical protein